MAKKAKKKEKALKFNGQVTEMENGTLFLTIDFPSVDGPQYSGQFKKEVFFEQGGKLLRGAVSKYVRKVFP